MASARDQSLSINMVMSSAIKGAGFLQVSVNKLHKYAKTVEKIDLLKATKFPLLKRNLTSLENHLGKIRSQSAKISANPIKLDIKTSRNSLKEARKDMTAIRREAEQTAYHSRQNAGNQRNNAKRGKRNISAGSVIGTAMAVAPLAMPLYEAVKFEQAVKNVEAITDKKYIKDLPLLKETALRLGSSTEWTMSEVAVGQKYLSKAGFSPKEIDKSMSGILSLGTIGEVDLKTASDIGSDVLGASKYKKSEMGYVADMIARTVTSENTDVVALGEALKYALPSTANKEHRGRKALPEALAIMGLLGGEGIKNGQAGRHYGIMTRNLTAPPKKAGESLNDLDVKVWGKDGNMKPLYDIIGQINTNLKLKKYSSAQRAMALKNIFGSDAAPSANILLGKGRKEIEEYTSYVLNVNNDAERMAKDRLNTVSGQFTIMKSAVSGLAITMSSQLLPPLKSFIQIVTNGVNNMQSWAKENPKLSAGLYGVGVAIGVATVGLMAFGLVATLVGTGVGVLGAGLAVLASPVILAIAGIATIAGGVYLIMDNWTLLKTFYGEWWNDIKMTFSNAWSSIKTAFGTTKTFFNNLLSGIKTNFITAWSGITSIVMKPINTIKTAWDSLMLNIETKLAWFTAKVDKIQNSIKKVTGFFSSGKNDGGKTVEERQKNIPKALQTPANNALFDPTKKTLHHNGIKPIDTLASQMKTGISPASIPSVGDITQQGINDAKAQTTNNNNQQTHQTFNNTINVTAQDGKVDPHELSQVLQRIQREAKHTEQDTQLQDVAS